MISAWLGRAPPTHFAHALHRETEGNPFFIEEVLRHLIEVGAVDATEWGRLASFTELGIPDGVREAIERRLATLSPATRRIVTMAAAIGRSFSIEVLEALAEVPARLARRARGGHGAPDRRGGTRCSGALRVRPRADPRDALRVAERAPPGGAAPPDRRDPRAAARRRPRTALGELAYHFVAGRRARSGGQGRRLLGPRGAAGARRARIRGGRRPLRARAQGPRALRLPRRATRCELLLGLGESHGKASEFEQSRAAFQAAAELARTAGLGEHLARAALGLARGWIEQGTTDPAIIALLEEALAALPDADTALRARLLGRLAMELHFSGEPERCQALARQSVALARRLADPSTLAFALNARHWAQRGQDEVGELLAIADEIIRRAEASAELELALQGHSWRLVDLLELGQTEEIDDEIAACATSPIAWASRSIDPGSPGCTPCERSCKAASTTPSGSPGKRSRRPSRRATGTASRRRGSSSRGAGRTSDAPPTGPPRSSASCATRCWPGRCQAARPRCGTATSPCSWPRPVSTTRARGYLDRVAECDDAELTGNVDGRSAAALAAEACALLGDERLARRLYELLLPRDGLCILGGRGVYFRGAAARYLGLLAATLGRADDAVRHLEDALETNTRAQAPPWIARSLLELARALLARGAPGATIPRRRPAAASRAAGAQPGDAIARGTSDTRTICDERPDPTESVETGGEIEPAGPT